MTATPAIFLAALVVALAGFAFFVTRRVRYLLLGQPEDRSDQLGRRTSGFVVYVLGQKKLFKEPVGVLHFFIFWGFIVIAFGALQIIGEGLLRDVLPAAARRLAGVLPAAGRLHRPRHRRRRRRGHLPLRGAPPAPRGKPRGGRHPGAHLRDHGGRPALQRLRLRARPAGQPLAGARHPGRCERRAGCRVERERPAERRPGLLVAARPLHARVPRVHPALQAPAPPRLPGQRVLQEPQARGRADPAAGPRGRGRRGVRSEPHRGLHALATPRPVRLRRVRPLPGPLPGLPQRQEPLAQDAHDQAQGSPQRAWPGPREGAGGRGRADRGRRPRGQHDRRRDLGGRDLGLHHLLLLPGAVPGAERARQQDRRHAQEPGAGPGRLPAGGAARLPQRREELQPVGRRRTHPRRLGGATWASRSPTTLRRSASTSSGWDAPARSTTARRRSARRS